MDLTNDLRAAERAEQRAWNAFCIVSEIDRDKLEEARQAWRAASDRLDELDLLARRDG